MDELIIGITHADGLAAEAILKALLQIDVEKASIRLYSSGDHVGKRLGFGDSYLVTLDQENDSFDQCGLVMQLETDESLSEKISKEGAILLKQGGDLYFSVNDEAVQNTMDYSQSVYSLVDSESYLMLKLLQSIHQTNSVVATQVTVLQPASSEGQAGVDELASQTVELLNARPIEPKIFPVQQAFNLMAKNCSSDALDLVQQVKLNLGEETELVQIQLIQVPVFYGVTFIFTVQCQFSLNQQQLESRFAELTMTQCVNNKDENISPVTSLQDDASASVSQVMVSEQNANNAQFILTADHLRHGTAELFLNAMLVIRKTFL